MLINLRENKKIIQKYESNKDIFSRIMCPLEDGSIVLKENDILLKDTCSICCESYKTNEKIKLWPKCSHPFHCHCYNVLRKEYKIKDCPICRSKINEIIIEQPMQFLFLNDDDDYYKNKIIDDEISPFYIDKYGNYNIRYKIFCNKYNFTLDENNYFSIKLRNIPVKTLFKILIFANEEKNDSVYNEIELLLNTYIVNNNLCNYEMNNKLARHNYKILLDNLDYFSNIFKLNSIQLSLFLINFIEKSKQTLINSNKKNFIETVKKFISSTEGITWFYVNDLSERKQFYQDFLVKIGGEKYRKLFSSVNIKEFDTLLYSF
jgi:hypothetical protein